MKSLRDFDESLKSIGDFENYVMTLENELKGSPRTEEEERVGVV